MWRDELDKKPNLRTKLLQTKAQGTKQVIPLSSILFLETSQTRPIIRLLAPLAQYRSLPIPTFPDFWALFYSSSMATFNFASPTHTHSSCLPLFPNSHSQNTPIVSFYSTPKPSSLFPSISFGPIPISQAGFKRRQLSVVVSALKNLSDTELVAVPPETDAIPGILPSNSGVYAVYDGNDDLQFLGISRNIAASIVVHRNSVPQLCCSVKVYKLLTIKLFILQ